MCNYGKILPESIVCIIRIEKVSNSRLAVLFLQWRFQNPSIDRILCTCVLINPGTGVWSGEESGGAALSSEERNRRRITSLDDVAISPTKIRTSDILRIHEKTFEKSQKQNEVYRVYGNVKLGDS